MIVIQPSSAAADDYNPGDVLSSQAQSCVFEYHDLSVEQSKIFSLHLYKTEKSSGPFYLKSRMLQLCGIFTLLNNFKNCKVWDLEPPVVRGDKCNSKMYSINIHGTMINTDVVR